MSYKVQIPDGVRDYTGKEAYAKRRLEQRVRGVFQRAGYEEMETPAFEYSEVFGEMGGERHDKMIRFFDSDGRQLALRPDFTMPVARVVTARRRMFRAPIRVFYIGNAYGLDHDAGLQQREFTQAGAELMGISGPDADAEAILLAADALEACGIKAYQLDIGHVGLFLLLAKKAGVPEEQMDALRGVLDTKNAPEAGLLLRQMGVSEEDAQGILSLCDLFGGPEVLDQAECLLPECKPVLEQLRSTCTILAEAGLGDKISIDLGLLPNLDYYTGVVFRGMAPDVGYQVLSGGRYDNAMQAFGQNMAATGFAMGMGRALVAAEKQGNLPCPPKADVAAGAEDGAQAKALAFCREQRAKGMQAIYLYGKTKEEVEDYARQNEITKTVYFENGGARA